MGSGLSRNRKVNRQIQVSSASQGRTRTPSPPVVIRSVNYTRRPYSSQPSPWLPKRHKRNSPPNSSLGQYTSIWESNGKLSSKFEQLIKSGSTNIEHDQKETNNKHLVTKHSSKYESAQVQSKLTSQFESIHNLSTSEILDTLMNNLKQTHTDFDQTVQRRIQQITSQTESVLAQIVQETQKSQQDLLIQAKEQQIIEDEQYRLLLEEFVAKLDEKRAKQLALIQEQLKEQRLQIFNESQLKIRAVSEQANSIKNQIMSEEERAASEKIDSIVNEINSISTDSAIQHLGTQIKTQINLTLYEKVGSNKSDKEFHFDEDDQQIKNDNNERISKRTIFISNQSSNQNPSLHHTSTKSSDCQMTKISQLVKQNPLN
ncbi:unnamed protein product [Rotaria sordida]|uniref:Uncharacterized protein n=1 Tax=Rotaria sordida TaxID=392033 RepID=A0A813URJ3_9BILA|nr:unnamed protein product [Rotaria sordida]CAF0811937.1 unnamed protein product [Rotaria sordida]CAF0818929.1 unnamed protein product [Rotaria sordida]CAF0832863.1 unnamed protein product [Rotaria sordida]CAF3882839.1 unnamed protein product [Rotaria sordida]